MRIKEIFNKFINYLYTEESPDPSLENYIAGKCNIGVSEKEKRKRIGLFFLILSVSYTFLGYVFYFPLLMKLLVIFPFFVSCINLIQFQQSFCVLNAVKGVYNVHPKVKEVQITESSAKKLDIHKAGKLMYISLFIAFGYTLLTIFLF